MNIAVINVKSQIASDVFIVCILLDRSEWNVLHVYYFHSIEIVMDDHLSADISFVSEQMSVVTWIQFAWGYKQHDRCFFFQLFWTEYPFLVSRQSKFDSLVITKKSNVNRTVVRKQFGKKDICIAFVEVTVPLCFSWCI